MTQETSNQHEEGIEIPFERISPETLQKMIEEFVTREWAEWGESGTTLDDKVAQVLRQLEEHSARVVYDLTAESWNIVAGKQLILLRKRRRRITKKNGFSKNDFSQATP